VTVLPEQEERTMRAVVLLSLFAAQAAFTQPVISPHGIVSNASYVKYGFRNYGIAQGSIFAIFGEKLGPDILVQVNAFPLQKELGGTSVQVTVGGVTVNALPLYVIAGQIGALMPSNTPLGAAKVAVTYRDQTSGPVETTIVRSNLALFAVDQGGSGPAIATNFVSPTNQPLNTALTPARPGQVVTLWGTGLGPVTGDEAAGPLPGNIEIPVRVQIASTEARVLYKGRSGCCSGLDQITIEIPQNVEGCHLPVFVEAGIAPGQELQQIPDEGAATEQTSIAVTRDGSACSDPTGLTASELTAIRDRGNIRLAWLWLENSGNGVEGMAVFGRFSSADILARIGVLGLPSPVNSCMFAYADLGGGKWPVPDPLDAGTLTLSGAGGTVQFTSTGKGVYTLSGAMLAPGAYTLQNAPGGRDVGQFTASFAIPQPLTWLNPLDVRKAELNEPAWTGADPNGFVVARHELSNNTVNVTPRCVSPASAGKMALPGGGPDPPRSNVMSLLFRGTFGSFRLRFSLLHFTPVRFSAPGLDVGLIAPAGSQSRSYSWN
jgi:uncharacterized protein (TIGR03437 family)